MRAALFAVVAATSCFAADAAPTLADDAPPAGKVPLDERQARSLQQQWARHLNASVVETNWLGMKMVLVPPGEFRQGASKRELDAITREIQQEKSVDAGMKRWSVDHIVPNEGPDHPVRVTKPYRIAAHEVTVGQFRKFVEATGYKTDAEREEIDPSSQRVRRTWKNPGFKQTEDEPVLEVSWHDAMALCRWLGKKEGRIYRLPTEAEWELAARAGSAGRWCFGNDRSRLDEYAWYSDNSGGKPHPVGTKKPNAFGIHDMHGNMWEYTCDFFADQNFEQRFGPKQPVAVDPTGVRWGYRTCLRGGSFDFYWFFQRATSRVGGAGRYQHHNHMGFRIAMVLGDDGPAQPVQVSLSGRRPAGAHPAAPPPSRLVKHASNPVLEIETNGVECRTAFSITRMDDVFYLWHAAKPPGIDRVVSADGIHWTDPGSKPARGLGSLFAGGFPLQWDDHEIAMPCALRVRDYVLQRDVLMMYYSGAGKDGGSGLGYASFLVGAPGRWYKQGLNPVLRGPIFYPCVAQVGESFVLWCNKSVDGKPRICRAASPDGARWTPIDMNPVLPLGKAGEFDSHSQLMPRVLQMGRSLYMWYLGSDGQTTRLGLATSSDGIHWTKSRANPILDLGGPDAWDGGAIVAHDVKWHDDRYHVWYAAQGAAEGAGSTADDMIRIGYATGQPDASLTVAAANAGQKPPAAAQQSGAESQASEPPLAKAPFDAQKAEELRQAWSRRTGKPVVMTNSIGMQLALLPPGEFTMGRTEEQFDELLQAIEKDPQMKKNRGGMITWSMLMMPAHRVRITRPFYMGATEVTVGQFRQFAEASGYKTEAERGLNHGKPYTGGRPLSTWRKPMAWRRNYKQQDDEPVMHLCWTDCVAFCKWLSEKEGVEYCLPTEAEWEYACRAGTTTPWSFGDLDDFDRQGNKHAIWSDGGQKFDAPQRVAQRQPNAFGLYDMHGNMWEYVADWWHRLSYKAAPLNDPTGPARQSEKNDQRRIIRGSSFDWGRWGGDSAYRMRITQRSGQHPHMSFRVAMRLQDVEGVPAAVDPDDERRRKPRDPGADAAEVASALKAGAAEVRGGGRDLPKQLTIDLGGDLKMEFVLIPAGSFLMGSAQGDKDELPLHRVVISKPFYMARHEVTQGQWQAVMGKHEWLAELTEGDNDMSGPTKAMNVLSWNDCRDLIGKLKQKVPGHAFALPTEAQWEYACRAGSATEFCFGDDASQLGEYAWFQGNMNWPGQPGFQGNGAFYHDVGRKQPNAWGLYDMHGGVWEWCADRYDAKYYFDAPLVDPTGPEKGRFRVLRGGSWFRYARYARSGYRRFFHPEGSSGGVTAWINDFGCRLVINLDGAEGAGARRGAGAATPRREVSRANGVGSGKEAPAVNYTRLARSLVRHPDNPVIKVGSPGEWDDQTLGCFTVLDDGDRFYFYSGGTRYGQPKRIGMATSADGVHWRKYEQNPLFPGSMPYAIKVGDTFRLYHPGRDEPGRRGLLMRTSTDGFQWSQPQLVLEGGVLDPCVVRVAEDRFHLYFCEGRRQAENGNEAWEFKNYAATSEDGVRWQREPEPILPLGPKGSWEERSHAGPCVLKLEDGFHIWYLGSGTRNGTTAWRVGHATSPDGLAWTRSGTEPVLDVGQPGAWDGGTLMSFDIVQRGGKLLFWYAAAPTGHGDETKMTIQIGHGTSR